MIFKRERYEDLETMDIKELYGYINEINGGYIKANYHPEDNNIVILNYTELATFERRWNKYTMSARGLILDLTDVRYNGIIYILANPFKKFFNYSENLEYEKDIDFNEIESVMEKMDGSLGISYIFKNEIRFATRGSFTSDQAIRATEIWKRKYSEANMKYFRFFQGRTPTLLVEIIYPENRIVVDYDGDEKLVLLGIIDGLFDCKYEEVDIVGHYFRLPVVPQYKLTLDELIEMKKTISANEEGWVLRFSNGKRLKIKGDEYIEVHRITHGLSDKAKFRAWSEGKIKDLIHRMPEEFRSELEEFEQQLDMISMSMYAMMTLFYLQAIEKHPEKKDFAIHTNTVIAKEYRKFMFDAYKKDKVSLDLIKEHMFKDYTHYLEVIRWKN